ncbi:MAG TPA: class I SAM-dependent RNA methyltransferase [Bryobacteraceae bacterium]|nr:class I SAM-dependent RNA methyltransferase [Bryobacteraceae bacterium]
MSNKLQPVEVEVEKLVYGGEGLARLDGQVLLAPFVLPGERVAVAAEHVKSGLLRGTLLNVIEAAQGRVAPRCEYFANCGGCHYQHAQYPQQLEQKKAILRETLQRLGGIVYEQEIQVLSADPWQYRNRIQLHFDNREMGFHKSGSHELCSIDHCEISSPALNDAIAKLQTAVRQPQWPRFLRSLELFTNESQLQMTVLDSGRPLAARFFEWCAGFLDSLASAPIEYPAAGYMFRISRGSFFQVNRFLIDSLAREVLDEAAGNYAVDLYAGAGLFSLPLSQRFARVDAIERGGPAFRDLEWNAGRRSAVIRPLRASAQEFLKSVADTPDLILADPPRAGLGSEATAELLRIRAPQLTIVSCDPATLARDLRKLLAVYRIARLTLVDLFPQTYHVETVAHLECI